MPYQVISECVDRATGRRYFPGPDSFFPETDPGQVGRLEASGCLKHVTSRSLDVGQRRAAAETREAATAELAQIEADLTSARNRKDQELRMIADEIGKARREADDEKARIAAEVEEMRRGSTADEGGALKDPAEIARQQINEDGLFEKTPPELKDIAAAEGVRLSAGAKKDDIIAAIRAKRAEKPAG